MLRLNSLVIGLVVLSALALPALADTLSSDQATALGLDPAYNAPAGCGWHYDPTLAPEDRHYYTLTLDPQSWRSAETEAATANGTLAIVNSGQERRFLTSEFSPLAAAPTNQLAPSTPHVYDDIIWVGLNAPGFGGVRGRWQWADGAQLSGVMGELNSRLATITDESDGAGHGYWKNWRHDFRHFGGGMGLSALGIIESKVVGAPEPATLALLAAGGLGLLRRRR